jgi:quinol monooxygenase YgiN
MTFVFCGMQPAGKSTIMERFMMAVLNIVHEGTGTRCPLDTTCIHDETCVEPMCDLWGEELLGGGGEGITVERVFEKITGHNQWLEGSDAFSTKPLHLIFRASNVQNMRFVDTPGIITTQGTGNDNREDIKTILRSEMEKQNSKLCLLLEPKEFQTNDIINFCDETLGGRANWKDNAICLMNKFDQKMEDTRTANKANGFFKTFHENGCFPYLVMTPALPNENLPISELFQDRQKLLAENEKERFQNWLRGQETYRDQNEEQNEILNTEVLHRIGFPAAKTDMRKIMLADTAKRLPEVIKKLREELGKREKEQRELKEKQKFTDPAQLPVVATDLVFRLQERILAYLDGDLQTAKMFPERLQSLNDEINDEEDSEWAFKDLNHHTERENQWRDNIADLEEYPDFVQAEDKFIGGKQCQRAINFFNWVMIDSLPDPTQLKEIAKNGCGYLGDGLRRENWERLMVQITKSCMNDITHPGTNYLVKHVGSILRRLFALAMDDVKQGEVMSATFKLLPTSVEKYLRKESLTICSGIS